MGSNIRIDLIGCGKWGENILRDLVSLGVDVFVYDNDSRIKDKAIRLGASGFDTKFENTGDSDGFIISTPATTHAKVLSGVINHKKPVFLEKPLCTSLDDLNFIKGLNSADIFLMHIWRYHNGIVRLGEICRSGELGELICLKTTRTNWTSPRTDTDSVWTLVPHDITIALEVLGYIPEPRFATCEFYNGQPKAMSAVSGKSSEFLFEVSNRYFDKRREVRAHFDRGVAVIKDERADFIEIFHGDENSRPEDVKVEKRKFDPSPPLENELNAFVDYLRGGSRPKSDLNEGIEVINTVLKLRKLAGINSK